MLRVNVFFIFYKMNSFEKKGKHIKMEQNSTILRAHRPTRH